MNYLLPVLIFCLFLYAIIKKAPIYELFTKGAKKSGGLVLSLLPYIFAMTVLIELMKACNLSTYLQTILSPVFSLLGIPTEVFEMVLFRPFTGSGAVSILESIYTEYGVDSYAARVASVISSSSETVIYMGAIYFTTKSKNQGKAVGIALLCTFLGVIFASLICKVL